MTTTPNISFVFFGTAETSVYVLDELEKKELVPELIVTAPDRPRGRGQIVTPPEVKVWAKERDIPVLQPEKLDEDVASTLAENNYEVFVVAAYGLIIPKAVLDIPEHGSLNVHPSLLPRHRGASPIVTQILEDDRETGVTIMLLDEKMDHGPIIAQEFVPVDPWPPKRSVLEETLMRRGGELLADVMPQWISGALAPQEQEHDLATYTTKIKKSDAELDLLDDPYQNLLKIRAYEGWPRTYFMDENNKRVIITHAEIEDGKLAPKQVIPEGKREMEWEEYERNS